MGCAHGPVAGCHHRAAYFDLVGGLCAWRGDGARFAAGCTNDILYLWPLPPTADRSTLLALHGHATWVTTVAFSPDGELVASGSGDQTVCLWQAHTGELLQTCAGHRDWIYAVAFSPDGRFLAGAGADGTICVWAVWSGQRLCQLPGHTRAIRSLTFQADGMLISGSHDETIELWDIQTGQCRATLCAPRPYEKMDITGATGINAAQKSALQALGAVEV